MGRARLQAASTRDQRYSWAYLRSNKLSNRVFETYEAIGDACCDAWNWLVAQPDQITSIGTRKWAQVSQ